MRDNEIIREVRRVRHQIARDCGYDAARITDSANEAYRRFESWKASHLAM